MLGGLRRNFWAVESSGDSLADAEAGMFYAAAHLRYVQINSPISNTSPLLGWIVRDMQAKGKEEVNQVWISFFSSLSRYLQSLTRFMPGQEIRNDHRRHLEFYRGAWEKYETMIAECEESFEAESGVSACGPLRRAVFSSHLRRNV